MRRKLLSVLALLCLTVTSAWAAVIDSGDCGTSVSWSLSDAGVLTISGTGAMTDYGWDSYPWNSYKANDIKSVVIENGVTNIPGQAFWCIRYLTSVSIPTSVTTIGEMAFAECGIESGADLVVTIADGSSLESIGSNAFVSSKLATITIPASVTSIGGFAFDGCSNLSAINVAASNTVYSSDGGVLFNKAKTTILQYPAAKTGASFEIPASVTNISVNAFNGNSVLTAITVAAGNTFFSSDGGVLFNNDKTTLLKYPAAKTGSSYAIPSSVTTISQEAFALCANLTSVTIGDNVERIGYVAFTECTSLATVNFGSKVKTIGVRAFYGCTSLTSVSIPVSVTQINEGAFAKCTNLATITLNSNPYIDDYVFDGIIPTPAVTMNLTANTAGGAKWMTFYNKLYSFQADANTQVFKAELSGTTITLHEVADRIVDGATPVVLKSTGNPVMTLTTTASGNTDGNSLWAVSSVEGQTSDGKMFVLSNGSNGVGFYKLTSGQTLGLGKAYLYYDGALSAREFFGFGGDATGINEIRSKMPEVRGDYFDLQGRRIMNPTKGLYIVNGKKVIIK